MTRQEIIKKYAFENGYIPCYQCPIEKDCESITCEGRETAYRLIAEHFNEPLEDEVKPQTSNVDHPNHYNQGNIECIDAMVAAYGKEAVEIFCLLNAFKYLWRSEHKNGNEDIDKAIWYLRKRLELIGG